MLKLKNKAGKIMTEKEWKEFCDKNNYRLGKDNIIRSSYKQSFVMKLEVVEERKWEST